MNLALTTFVILILAVPGYIARVAYFQDKFTKNVLSRNLTDDIVRAIMYSLPFHLAGMFVVEHLYHLFGIGTDIDFNVMLRLLAGEYGDKGKEFDNIVKNIYNHFHGIIAYFAILGGVSYLVGDNLRRVVWDKKWDVKWPFIFGYDSPWVYLLFGRDLSHDPETKFLSYVDALVELAGHKTRLYRGIVLDFTTDESGMLRDLILIEGLRGKFKERGDGIEEFYWEKVPGDRFVIRYTEVKNLNITFSRMNAEEESQTRCVQMESIPDPPEANSKAAQVDAAP